MILIYYVSLAVDALFTNISIIIITRNRYMLVGHFYV